MEQELVQERKHVVIVLRVEAPSVIAAMNSLPAEVQARVVSASLTSAYTVLMGDEGNDGSQGPTDPLALGGPDKD